MACLNIKETDIPNLEGQTAIVTGGSSGIGLAAAKILASRGARVVILDVCQPNEALPSSAEFRKCDISRWSDLSDAFSQIGPVQIAIANAGVDEDGTYLNDSYNDNGDLLEPNYDVIDVNFRGTLNFVKLALHSMKRNGAQGSIVLTSSATAYSPEQSLPVYSGTKAALINYLRAMRSNLRDTGITINAVAPAATITGLLPAKLAAPIMDAGLPVSSAHFVGLAVVYSAVAMESEKVQAYGKDNAEWKKTRGRWSGRVILTLGERYTELEGPLANCRDTWMGAENLQETEMQQAATDFRHVL
ncbi:short chain dehydrogenase reductase [Colletotrichum godetiae]|uniref:Short chain dehydrogenase reductase n=1 Tax=Colletotrichum godetiae TaxID=1209918 RepID=A0AAJ0A8P0_9PEZI|nr:short chain dehydrogenase reductase [Colletotrichum godetiae]KAK1657953.1 short chain dehydrogenase reductase [Colletotrichum godetiae]